MALLWMDGFDHYGTNGTTLSGVLGIAGAYDNVDGTFTVATMPILGGLGLRAVVDNQDPVGLDKVMATTYGTGTTLGIGGYVYINSYNNSDSSRGQSLFHFKNAAQSAGIFLNILNTGQLQIRSGSVIGSSLGTSTEVMADDTLYHVEMKVGLHASTGTVEVRVGGVVWINATGLNTLQSTTMARFGFGAGNYAAGQNVDMYWDSVFVWDGTGSVNNDFFGDCIVETLFPNADTADADWTKSSGSDGYNLINDVPAVGTNYIEAAAATDESIFEMTALSTTAYTIKGVMAAAVVEKTTSGASTVEVGVETNNVQSVSAPQSLTELVWLRKHHMVENNPDTAAAWTPTEVNAIQVVLDRAA